MVTKLVSSSIDLAMSTLLVAQALVFNVDTKAIPRMIIGFFIRQKLAFSRLQYGGLFL